MKVMIANDNNIKIVIVEDSEFFNKALTEKLKKYSDRLSKQYDVDFTIESYLKSEDFIMNLRNDIDIVFTDYYLGRGINAQYILKRVKLYCDHSEVVVMSQSDSERTSKSTLKLGANQFIYKDSSALKKACFYLSHYMNEHWNPRRFSA